MVAEPEWLTWTRELQAIAQTGLAFVRDSHDRERYEMLRVLASKMMAAHTAAPVERIQALFENETGYATPKVDVRGAVFDDRGRLLLVRERADGGRRTLPGGWADVNLTAAENVVKEVREESGFDVRVRKVAAVWDRTRQGHANGVFSCCKLFYICDIVGGAAATGPETSEVEWSEAELPDELSLGRVMPDQLRRMFEHARDPLLPTEFD
jgi:ADP-ribose pyrophosphatase YjhB (NUDIX family)